MISCFMKGVIFFLLILPVFLTGCAMTENSVEDVGQQFQQGLQGEGKLTPNNPTSDSFGPEYR